jgi:hypothetical protein
LRHLGIADVLDAKRLGGAGGMIACEGMAMRSSVSLSDAFTASGRSSASTRRTSTGSGVVPVFSTRI